MTETSFYLTIFDKNSGAVSASLHYATTEEFKSTLIANALASLPDTSGIVEGFGDPSTHYVTTIRGEPALVPRQNMRISLKGGKKTLVANGTDTVELTGLPNPCTIVQDPGEPEETSHEVTGGGFVFSAETPGKYQFRVDRFPFLPFSIEFTAT